MSASANPDIVDDGLVFLYDTDDGKSYKGEPTTNVIAGTNLINTVGGTYTTNTTVDGVRILENNQVNNSHVMWNGATGFIVTCSAGAYVTVSAEYKTNCTIRMRFRDNPYDSQYDIDGGNIATISEQSVDIDTNGEWKRYSLTAQTSTANPDLWWYIADYRSNNEFGRVEIRNWQVEVKSHATQFVNGTRSATQGLLDRTGNSTIDLSNTSFDSNAQMTFDGTDDQLIVYNVGIDNYSEAFSYECVFKAEGTWANDRISNIVGILGSYAGHYGLGKSGTNTINFVVRDANYNSISSTVSDTSTYHHLVGVWDQSNSQIRLYIDGELKSSATVTKTGTPDSNDLRIGGRAAFGGSNGSYYHGDIPIVKYYKTALTTAEVLQNYNATKSRFNL